MVERIPIKEWVQAWILVALSLQSVLHILGILRSRGKLTTYQYDGINRRTFAGYGTVTGQKTTYESTVTNSYDGGNRLTKVVDTTSGTIAPVFDGLDRLTSE